MRKSGFKISFFLAFRIMLINSETTGDKLQEQMVKLYEQMSVQNGQMTTLIENQNTLIRSLSDQLFNRNGKIDELEQSVDQCNGKMMRFENSMSNEMVELKSGLENATNSIKEVEDEGLVSFSLSGLQRIFVAFKKEPLLSSRSPLR